MQPTNTRTAFLSYTNHSPCFTGYTHQELALLKAVSTTSYLASINQAVVDRLGPEHAPVYDDTALHKVFEAYASDQFPDLNPDPRAFAKYVVDHAKPRRVVPPPTQHQLWVRSKRPEGKALWYPEVPEKAGERLILGQRR